MANFDNVRLNYQNFSLGPIAGRIYSFDHVNDTLIVKTFPTGALIGTFPLDSNLFYEVLDLEYDGYYFWTLMKLGGDGTLGVMINKWFYNGTTVIKQLGNNSEIPLVNNGPVNYDSEAFCVRRYKTALSFFASSGSTTITLGDVTFLEVGDSVYIGPSTAASGELIERKVSLIVGNVVTLTQPLSVNFNSGDQVIYRKDIWVFNNNNLNSTVNGSLIRIDSNNGLILSSYTSTVWKHVTAATSHDGNLLFARGSQILQYRPFGSNAGFVNSAYILNTETDNNTVIKVYDLSSDSSNIYKLQKKQHQYDSVNFVWTDVDSLTNKYEIDTEQIAAKVTSITAKRDKSVLFGVSSTTDLTVKVTDQYDFPVFSRVFTITEDDLSGNIPTGFTPKTTDTNGEFVTRYSTGATPNFSNPTVFVRDNINNYRLPIRLEQKPRAEGKANIRQDAKSEGTTTVIQQQPGSSVQIEQTIFGRNDIPIEQRIVENEFLVTQEIISCSGLQIQQDSLVEDITTIEQYGPVIGEIEINQFVFLIFAIPAPYSKKNQPNTNILVRIVGFGGIPLNSSTLIFKVNGFDVTSSVVVTPITGGLELFYNPPVNFDYNSTVSMYIEIDDINIPVRTIRTSYTFDIIKDYTRPYVSLLYPPDNSINNLPLTEIYAIIEDQETGIDTSTIQMYVDGKEIISPVIELLDNTKQVKVSYTPTLPFSYESEVFVSVIFKDLGSNQTIESWSFTIKTSSGVLFVNESPEKCSVLVPLETNICSEVFGLEEGLNLNTIKLYINGQEVEYVINPKVYRKE